MGARRLSLRIAVALCASLAGLLCVPALAPAALTHGFVSSFASFASVQSVAVGQGSSSTATPEATTGEATALTTTGATLNGTVSPQGTATTYQFEYTKGFLGNPEQELHFAPATPADAGSGTSPVAVSAHVTGLEPNTFYQYRLVATNTNGTVTGNAVFFTTLSPPLVIDERAVSVSATNATLGARIDRVGFGTTYHFEYGPTAAYGTSVPVPDAEVGLAEFGAEGYTPVSQQIFSLQSGAVYHYRVVASNANGTTVGSDKTLTTIAPPAPAEGDSCPNAQIRFEQGSGFLNDCRAYELVSPAQKEGAQVTTSSTEEQISTDGERVKYISMTAVGSEGSEAQGAEYIGQRGSEGWKVHSINPEQNAGTSGYPVFDTPRYEYLTPDLSKGVFFATTPVTSGHPNVELVPNLYLRNDLLSESHGNYELLSDSVSPLPRWGFRQERGLAFAAASEDMNHILFETGHDLTSDSSGLSESEPKAYEWDEGTVRLAGILPNGEAASGSVVGAGASALYSERTGSWPQYRHAVSADGSRVIFEGSPLVMRGKNLNINGNLYMRIDHKETIQLNVSERAIEDPKGPQPATFWFATPDGSKVFFSTPQALTDDTSEAGSGEENVYEYDVNAPVGKHLTLISVDNEPSETSHERELSTWERSPGTSVAGISKDGSYVYFLGYNRLVAGQPPFALRPTNFFGELYVWHNGVVRAITSDYDYAEGRLDWGQHRFFPGEGSIGGYEFRTSEDGKTIMFKSSDPETAQQTGHDNVCVGGGYCDEIYVYRYDTNKIACASCNPSGASPVGSSTVWSLEDWNRYPVLYVTPLTEYQNNALSSDGRRVFFETPDPLVPSDTNGELDVYEYDVESGQIHLLSTGRCACASHFIDATPDGGEVMITTRERLVQADFDLAADVYVVRPDGGIPSQNVPPPVPCGGDDCQGPAPSPPVLSIPASATFAGAGNTPPPSVAAQPEHKSKPAKHHKKHRRKRGRKAARHASRRAGR